MWLLTFACDTATPDDTPPSTTTSTPTVPTKTSTEPPPPPVPRPAAHRNGDLDGDGYDDLVVSEPYRDGIGVALVYRGGPGRTLDAAPDRVLSGVEEGALWGVPVDLPGDLDGDGVGDLLVGAPYGQEAVVTVWMGDPGLTLAEPIVLSDDGADGLFGLLARGAGDVTGDGHDDLVIGAPTGNYAVPGRAYLVHGGPAFDGEIRTELFPLAPSPGFAQAGGGVGDVDGDGVSDLLLARSDWLDDEFDHAELFLGGSDGGSDQALAGPKGFAAEVAGVGDFDGDGRSDVVISVPNTFADDLGRLFLHAGAPTGLEPVASMTYTEAGDTFVGASLASASDLDGDGAPDFVCGAPFAGADRGGLAYVVLGGTDIEPDILLEGSGPGVGWQVGVIDANGDGRGDVLVNRQDYASPDLDRVRIYFGGLSFDGVADTILVGGGPEDEFGHDLPRGLLR